VKWGADKGNPVRGGTVVIVIGVGIESFDVVGMRSSSFNQTGIVAAIGMVDVVSLTKIAIE
jgi:hypothetical protein